MGSQRTSLGETQLNRAPIDELRAAITLLPDDALLPVRLVKELLQPTNPERGAGQFTADFTVEQLAEKLGRAPSTVRAWAARGEIEGAYRLYGREWRISAAAAIAFQAKQRDQRSAKSGTPDTTPVDLSAWRSVNAQGEKPRPKK